MQATIRMSTIASPGPLQDASRVARPGSIASAGASYALQIVERICAEIGPGVPGSAQERARAEVIRKELAAHLGAGNVAVEEFTVAPNACLGSVPISAVLVLVAAVLNVWAGHLTGAAAWALGIGAVVVAMAAIALYVVVFVLGGELLDPLFGKKASVNVIGTLRAPGIREPKRLLVLSGHHDSGFENLWFSVLGYGFLVAAATAYLGFLVLLVMCVIQLVGMVAGHAGAVQFGTLGWGLLAYPIVPAVLFGLFFTGGRRDGGTVPGAADNLAASAVVVAMARFLARNPAYVPADTEIRFISFGSEEAGLRGSRRYVERHLDELNRLDARVLNLETIADPEIGILTSDVAGTVKYSPAMVSSVVAAAERAGVPYKVKAAFLGVATDGSSFAKAGIAATTLLPFKVPRQLVAFYHQKSDRPDVLSMDALANVLKLALEWIRGGES